MKSLHDQIRGVSGGAGVIKSGGVMLEGESRLLQVPLADQNNVHIQQRNAESLDRILTGGNSVAHSNNSRHRKRAIAIADVESSHSRGGGADGEINH